MRAGKIAVFVLFLAAMAAALTAAAPVPSTWQYSAALFYGTLPPSMALVVLHLGAVALFLLSLGAYKQELRRAYILICAGIALTALGTLQLPVISWLNAWGSWWVTDGVIGIPFLLSGLTVYGGMRSLGLLVGVRTWQTKLYIVWPVVIGLCVLSSLLPHVSITTTELTYDAAVAILLWAVLSFVVALSILWRVRERIGAHYASAMTWLLVAFSIELCGLVLAVLGALLSSKTQDGFSVAIDSVGAVAGLVLLGAGYAFTKTRDY